MPTDVISAACSGVRFGQKLPKRTCDAEKKSGFLVLLGPGGIRQDVRVVVYHTSLEHFAVIYPRKRLSKPMGVLNLRNTAVQRADAGFNVRQKDYDNTSSANFVCSERDVEPWMAAFTSRSSPCLHHASLPVLLEDEESHDN